MNNTRDEDHHSHDDEPFQERLLSPAQNRDRDFRVKALEGLLAEKELISDQSLDGVLDAYQNDIGPLNGARVVARAWTDPAFKARLLENGTEAIADQQDLETRATYYESWLRAFEKLLQAKGILERKTISKRVKNMKRADYMRRTRLPIHMVPFPADDDDEDDDDF